MAYFSIPVFAAPRWTADPHQVFVSLSFLFLPSASLILVVFGVYMNHTRSFPEILALMCKASENQQQQTRQLEPSLPTATHLHSHRPPPLPAPGLPNHGSSGKSGNRQPQEQRFRVWITDIHKNHAENTKLWLGFSGGNGKGTSCWRGGRY